MIPRPAAVRGGMGLGGLRLVCDICGAAAAGSEGSAAFLSASHAAPAMTDVVTVTRTRTVEVEADDREWTFAAAERASIDAYFADLASRNPSLFNGAIWMLAEWSIDGQMFRGRVIRTDYASFLYWRDNGFADPSVANAFGSGALHSADGALILGVMGAHTANAGKIYPPSGSFEDDDLVGGRIDVSSSIIREIAEETGLVVGGREAAGWTVVAEWPRVALIRRIDLGLTADEVEARVAAHLSADPEPELAGLHVVRGLADIVEDRMPPYIRAYIRGVFAG